jgi:hypothetical protein
MRKILTFSIALTSMVSVTLADGISGGVGGGIGGGLSGFDGAQRASAA